MLANSTRSSCLTRLMIKIKTKMTSLNRSVFTYWNRYFELIMSPNDVLGNVMVSAFVPCLTINPNDVKAHSSKKYS